MNVVRLAAASGMTKAVVIFLPGAAGGVAPCRMGGQSFDAGALFPKLAQDLSADVPIDSYRVSWMSRSPDVQEMVHAVCRVALYALTIAGNAAPVRLVLLGHSFGGAVAFSAAQQLRVMLAGTRAHIAGVVGHSPQAISFTHARATPGQRRLLSLGSQCVSLEEDNAFSRCAGLCSPMRRALSFQYVDKRECHQLR